MPRKLIDLTGQRFERLVVLQHGGILPSGQKTESFWRCLCDCGNEVLVSNNNIKRGQTKSCGCYQKDRAKEANLTNIAGRRFGMLLAVEYVGTRNKNAYWRCMCDCGKETEASACSLKSGGTKSCGCRQGWWRSPVPGLWKDKAAYSKWQRQDPLIKLRHRVSGSIRGMIKHNGGYKRRKSIRNHLPYSIEELKAHLESQWETWMSWDNYGGWPNEKRKTWHIDHIKPHCLFPYKSMDDPLFEECWALSNLRPLEKKANIRKGKKYCHETMAML